MLWLSVLQIRCIRNGADDPSADSSFACLDYQDVGTRERLWAFFPAMDGEGGGRYADPASLDFRALAELYFYFSSCKCFRCIAPFDALRRLREQENSDDQMHGIFSAESLSCGGRLWQFLSLSQRRTMLYLISSCDLLPSLPFLQSFFLPR